MINIVLKFRFSLLSLMIFTAIVAVGFWWYITPYTVTMTGKEFGESRYDVSKSMDCLLFHSCDRVQLKVKRRWGQESETLSPLIGYADSHYLCLAKLSDSIYSIHDRKQFQNATPAEIEKQGILKDRIVLFIGDPCIITRTPSPDRIVPTILITDTGRVLYCLIALYYNYASENLNELPSYGYGMPVVNYSPEVLKLVDEKAVEIKQNLKNGITEGK